MGKNLTKNNIKFNEVRIFKETTLNPNTGQEETRWYTNIGYKVITTEGEQWNKNKQVELKGQILTDAQNYFTKIENNIKVEEGI